MTAPDPSQLQDTLLADVAAANSLDALEAVRVSALGKNGAITGLMKGLGLPCRDGVGDRVLDPARR